MQLHFDRCARARISTTVLSFFRPCLLFVRWMITQATESKIMCDKFIQNAREIERISTNRIIECCIRNTVTLAAINFIRFEQQQQQRQQIMVWRRHCRQRAGPQKADSTTQLINRGTHNTILVVFRRGRVNANETTDWLM